MKINYIKWNGRNTARNRKWSILAIDIIDLLNELQKDNAVMDCVGSLDIETKTALSKINKDETDFDDYEQITKVTKNIPVTNSELIEGIRSENGNAYYQEFLVSEDAVDFYKQYDEAVINWDNMTFKLIKK